MTSSNAKFWSYVCGSQRKRQFGDGFDEWFWQRYPWLERYIPFDDLLGKRVLEVGIGSGTTARRLAATTDFTALDIASEPLEGLPGQQGSILEAPFEDNVFDYVVSIGCIHHTGNVPLALKQIYRILKPGGGTTLMVYHKNSGLPEVPRLWDSDPKGNGPPFTEWFTRKELVDLLEDFVDIGCDVVNFRAPGGMNLYATARKPHVDIAK